MEKKMRMEKWSRLFKTSLPSEFVDHKIYEEVKGLGSLIKSETFENSGRRV